MNRNEACSCGSGRKFKHCHGAGVEAPRQVAAQTISNIQLQRMKTPQGVPFVGLVIHLVSGASPLQGGMPVDQARKFAEQILKLTEPEVSS